MGKITASVAIVIALALSSIALAQDVPATVGPNAAEVAFWTSVKDTKNPAELRAYLTAFPSGLFAQLARLRLEELERPAAGQPAQQTPSQAIAPAIPAPRPSSTALADIGSTSVVREIQLKLYDLNYDPGRVDGVLTSATRGAIRDWQRNADQNATGDLTEEQLQALRDTRSPAPWAAVAYTANGANGWVFGRPSRAQAEQEAIDLCIKKAGRSAACKPITASGSACITMASYTTRRGNTTYYGSHVALRPNQTASISEALRQCGEAQNSGNNCVTRVTICADGSHRK